MSGALYLVLAVALQVPRAVDLAVHEITHCRLESHDGACEVTFYENWTANATVSADSRVPHAVAYLAGWGAAACTLLPGAFALGSFKTRRAPDRVTAGRRWSARGSRPGNGLFGLEYRP